MRGAAAACRAREVFAVATHGLYGPGSDAMLADPAIDRIVVSDSILTATVAGHGERIKIVSVAPLIGETVHRLHLGSPLGDAASLEA
jgi:ribose-phosphate pyrophosphokinase